MKTPSSSHPTMLPPSVVERLNAERQRIEKGAFTSSFDVSEMLTAKAAGYEAIGQVMGASVFRVGAQWTSPLWGVNSPNGSVTSIKQWRNGPLTKRQRVAQKDGYEMEIVVHTTAYATARRLALSRLKSEAALLGASGVVGVKLEMKTSHNKSQPNVIEFKAIGTAVKLSQGRRTETPFLSNLSGEEVWQLATVGYQPCGFVGGNCSYFRALSLNTAGLLEGVLTRVDQATFDWAVKQKKFGFINSWRLNFELPEYTEAIYVARELAIARLEDEAKECGAEGVIGLTVGLDENAHIAMPSNGNILTPAITFSFLALGTAIRRAPSLCASPIASVLNLP